VVASSALLPGPSRVRAVLFVRAWQLVAAGGVAFLVVHGAFGVGGAGLDYFANRWLYDGLEFSAAAALFARGLVVRSERAAWLLLGTATMLYAIGDVCFDAVYNGNPPVPSTCDAFYLAFYPLSYVALVLLVKSRLSRFNGSVWLDGLMAALTTGAVGAAFLVEFVLDHRSGQVWADATNLAYPLGDVVLLGLVVGVFALAGWRPGRGWALIGLAFVPIAVADALFLYQYANNTYVEGSALDSLWPASLILLASAAWVAPNMLSRVALEGRPLAGTPAVCGLTGLAVLIDSYMEHRNVGAVALASAAVLAVLLRTLLTLRENSRITEGMQLLSVTDPLTGLANRRQFTIDLEAALSADRPQPRLLVIFDLNGFKYYNDSYGHPAGDALLTRLGAALSSAVEPYGSCYRLGGDEFCALATVQPDQLDSFLTATTRALSEEGEGFAISTAYGCAFLPDQATVPSEALRLADQRLYSQKHQSLISRGQPDAVLMQTLLEREPDLHNHVGSVADLSLRLGHHLGLDEAALAELKLAAQLHDVGKLAIPDSILTKPGPLNDSEWELMRRHTLIGRRILDASPALQHIGAIVRATHEHWDGTGYPDQVAGSAIPLAARIITVCDAYSAMTSDRPYRAARSPQEALDELRRCAGNQFDPQIVEAFHHTHTTSSSHPALNHTDP
jgi:two-component system, cell cycle response regulator